MGRKINTNRADTAPTTIDVVKISAELPKPHLGSITIPIIYASKNTNPIKRADNRYAHRVLMPTKQSISHIRIARVPSGMTMRAPRCRMVINSVFIGDLTSWPMGKIIDQAIIGANAKYPYSGLLEEI